MEWNGKKREGGAQACAGCRETRVRQILAWSARPTCRRMRRSYSREQLSGSAGRPFRADLIDECQTWRHGWRRDLPPRPQTHRHETSAVSSRKLGRTPTTEPSDPPSAVAQVPNAATTPASRPPREASRMAVGARSRAQPLQLASGEKAARAGSHFYTCTGEQPGGRSISSGDTPRR